MLWRYIVGGCIVAGIVGIYIAQCLLDRRDARRKKMRDEIDAARRIAPRSLGDSSGIKCGENGTPRGQQSDSDLRL